MEQKDIELLTSSMVIDVDEAMDFSWLIVDSEESFENSQGIKDVFNSKIKEVKDYFAPRKQVAQQAHKLWVSAEKEALKPYESAKGTVVAKQNSYLREKQIAFKAAEDKLRALKEESDTPEALFIPPMPKQKGTRTTWTGDVTDIKAFLLWAIETETVYDFITLKPASLNGLAKSLSTSKGKVPGFKAVKNVSAL